MGIVIQGRVPTEARLISLNWKIIHNIYPINKIIATQNG